MNDWRDGYGGALIMGIRHGAFCVACCWVLMALLFVTGIMNLLWVAVIAGFVLLEKVAPKGQRIGWAAGLVLIGLAGWTLRRWPELIWRRPMPDRRPRP